VGPQGDFGEPDAEPSAAESKPASEEKSAAPAKEEKPKAEAKPAAPPPPPQPKAESKSPSPPPKVGIAPCAAVPTPQRCSLLSVVCCVTRALRHAANRKLRQRRCLRRPRAKEIAQSGAH